MRGLQCLCTCSPSPVDGLFLDPAAVPSSFAACIPDPCWGRNSVDLSCNFCFLSVSLKSEGRSVVAKEGLLGRGGEVEGGSFTKRGARPVAVSTTKHLWAGAVAAMVSRTFVAPLERLKLEYIVRGEKKNLLELIETIATSQESNCSKFLGMKRPQILKDSLQELQLVLLQQCSAYPWTLYVLTFYQLLSVYLYIHTILIGKIRTVLVAPGGEAMGGIIHAFRRMIQTEGFISLYKGLVPSILSVAPSGTIFYGVYDILKSAYLHSPEGQLRRKNQQQGQELNAFDKLELGPYRTLFYGALSGACAEVVTYPLEVVRRRLRIQARANRMNAWTTFVKIVDQGGVPALYAGLLPSLLQVLPSPAISYFVYEFMKIVLKVE